MITSFVYILLIILILNMFPYSIDGSGMGQRFLFMFVPIIGFISYQLLSEILNHGQSWGKKTMGIRVVRVDGQEPGLGDYLMRSIFLIIDVMLSFGTIAMIFISASSKKQRLGDITANTTVIKANSTLSFRLQDILNISSIDNYKPTYPQVKQLTEADMLFIKKAIVRYQEYKNPAHQKVILDLTNHLKNILKIESEIVNRIEFLKILIKDYIVLTR